MYVYVFCNKFKQVFSSCIFKKKTKKNEKKKNIVTFVQVYVKSSKT